MYNDQCICAVVPCFNVSSQIGMVLETMPKFVDHVVIIDDASTDATRDIVEEYQKEDTRIVLLVHQTNQGVGGAVATGCKWAKKKEVDIAVIMDGDGQMDPSNLPALLNPVVSNQVDFAKGNRLFTGEAYTQIPKVRYFGNACLSFLTKIASGYWHVADSQSSYSAMNKRVLYQIEWDKMYKRYGRPNDLLIRLNVANFRVTDVPVRPVYNIGEKSGIRLRRDIFTISWLLLRMFFWRLKEKYIIRDFHPLVLFYLLGGFFAFLVIPLSLRMFYYWFMIGHIPPLNALAAMFAFMSATQFLLFAMWFDMEANKHLK